MVMKMFGWENEHLSLWLEAPDVGGPNPAWVEMLTKFKKKKA